MGKVWITAAATLHAA